MICSPSFLSCDFHHLESEIRSISEAKWLHFDVMDGKFVINTTYNYEMLETIGSLSDQFFDCHLMIEDPRDQYQKYIQAGADLVTFHLEAESNPLDLLRRIQKSGVKAGISIKPDTDVQLLYPVLSEVDLILIMSVEPGKGGQKFLANALDKISYLNDQRTKNHYRYLIEVDGGINFDTAALVKNVGCDVIVVGSFLFRQTNRNQLIKELEHV